MTTTTPTPLSAVAELKQLAIEVAEVKRLDAELAAALERRAAAIVAAKDSHATWAAICDTTGLCRQRVYLIAKQHRDQ